MKLPEGLSFDHVPELQTLWAELSELRHVLAGLPALVSAVDREGLFVFWNRECERVTGYTSQEVHRERERVRPALSRSPAAGADERAEAERPGGASGTSRSS